MQAEHVHHEHPIERMAGSKPHPGRRLALEIVTFILFILFMMPFLIVVLNSMRTNAEIINQPVGWPENAGNLFANIKSVWENPTDRKSTRLNSSHPTTSRMPSSA